MEASASQVLWGDFLCSPWGCLAAAAMHTGQQEVGSASERQLGKAETPSTVGIVLHPPPMDLLRRTHPG